MCVLKKCQMHTHVPYLVYMSGADLGPQERGVLKAIIACEACVKNFGHTHFNEPHPHNCRERDKQPEKSMELDFFTLQQVFRMHVRLRFPGWRGGAKASCSAKCPLKPVCCLG